jgi:putative flippase GtrA
MVIAYLLSIFEKEILFKFIKFGVVGFSGIFVDFGITYFLKEKVKLQKYVANSLGFLSATCSNYFLNRYWTFQSDDPAIFTQFGKFFAFSLIGLVLNNFIIYILNDRLKMNFYISKLIAIGIVSIWNFGANYIYTFTN